MKRTAIAAVALMLGTMMFAAHAQHSGLYGYSGTSAQEMAIVGIRHEF